MNDLIPISYENDTPTVSGRQLHEFLGVETPYRKWFPRMCEYDFTENIDYTTDIFVHPKNLQETMDHALSMDMAKELCMLQRTDRGKELRHYFIQVERSWNSPEQIMARALQIANDKMSLLQSANQEQTHLIKQLKPKADYYDLILASPSLMTTTQIAKDYGMSAVTFNKLLHEYGIQFKQGKQWHLYAKYQDCGYVGSKVFEFNHSDGKPDTKPTTAWTHKGRKFLYDVLKGHNLVPMIERDIIA